MSIQQRHRRAERPVANSVDRLAATLLSEAARRGMTLRAVGDVCGVSAQCVYNWRSGRRRMNTRQAEALMRALKLRLHNGG